MSMRWAIRNSSMHAFWQSRAAGYRIYWAARNFVTRRREGLRDAILASGTALRSAKMLARVSVNAAYTSIEPRFRKADVLENDLALVSIDKIPWWFLGKSTIVEARSSIRIPKPRFIGNAVESKGEGWIDLEQPKLEIVEFSNAFVFPATDFVVRNHTAIHSSYFVPSRDVCMGERFNAMKLLPKRTLIRHMFDTQDEVDAAVSLVGQCTGNWGHWLTETLPKLLMVDAIDGYEQLPLLVDDWIHPNHFETIKLFNKHARDIVPVMLRRPVYVKKLVYVKPVCYAPPEYRSFVEHGKVDWVEPEIFTFSRSALDLVRTESGKLSSTAMPQTAARKILIERKSPPFGNGRAIINIADINAEAESRGFNIIEPSALPVLQQMAIFREAKVIVSPIGAALVNALFAKPGCKIIALAPHYAHAHFYYFSNLMAALGHDLYYVTGPQIEDSSAHPLHRDFRIDIDIFRDAIDRVA